MHLCFFIVLFSQKTKVAKNLCCCSPTTYILRFTNVSTAYKEIVAVRNEALPKIYSTFSLAGTRMVSPWRMLMPLMLASPHRHMTITNESQWKSICCAT